MLSHLLSASFHLKPKYMVFESVVVVGAGKSLLNLNPFVPVEKLSARAVPLSFIRIING